MNELLYFYWQIVIRQHQKFIIGCTEMEDSIMLITEHYSIAC